PASAPETPRIAATTSAASATGQNRCQPLRRSSVRCLTGAHRRLTSEPEPLQVLRVLLPVLGHLDVQVEVDRHPQEPLDALPGAGADLAEAGATGADDDGLLGGTFDVEVDADIGEGVGAVGAG